MKTLIRKSQKSFLMAYICFRLKLIDGLAPDGTRYTWIEMLETEKKETSLPKS